MPESKGRKKKKPQERYTPPPTKSQKNMVSPPWVGPTILVLFGIGVAWLVVYYVTNGGIVGQEKLGAWNVPVGFGFILGGFGLATQWR